jgi:hypothetical protein
MLRIRRAFRWESLSIGFSISPPNGGKTPLKANPPPRPSPDGTDGRRAPVCRRRKMRNIMSALFSHAMR